MQKKTCWCMKKIGMLISTANLQKITVRVLL